MGIEQMGAVGGAGSPSRRGFGVCVIALTVGGGAFVELVGGCRRLNEDYDQLPLVSEVWIGLAFMAILVRRLTRRNS